MLPALMAFKFWRKIRHLTSRQMNTINQTLLLSAEEVVSVISECGDREEQGRGGGNMLTGCTRPLPGGDIINTLAFEGREGASPLNSQEKNMTGDDMRRT